MAGPMPGLLTLMEELYGRINKERLFGGGVRGAATRGLLGADAPENATPAEMDAYRNIANASMALAAGPVAATRAIKGAKTLKNAPQAQAMETARQNAVKMLGLPESNTAMDRARAMGFDTNAEFYHATSNDFIDPKISATGKLGPGFYLARSPQYAERYGGNSPQIMPVYTRGKFAEQNVRDEVSEAIRQRMYAENPNFSVRDWKTKTAEKLKNLGYSGVDVDAERAVITPSNIRSRFAAFDPARIDERDLLASLAAMGITLPLTMGLLSEQTD